MVPKVDLSIIIDRSISSNLKKMNDLMIFSNLSLSLNRTCHYSAKIGTKKKLLMVSLVFHVLPRVIAIKPLLSVARQATACLFQHNNLLCLSFFTLQHK